MSVSATRSPSTRWSSRAEVEIADVVGGERAGLRARDEHAAAGHRGKVRRDPAQIVEAHLRRVRLEVEEHGVVRPGHRAAAGEARARQRPARQAEHRAVAPKVDPAHRVAQRHRRIAHASGERVEVDREGLAVGGGDPEPRHPGGEVGEEDHLAEPFRRLLDQPARLGPLRRRAPSRAALCVVSDFEGFHGSAIRSAPPFTFTS